MLPAPAEATFAGQNGQAAAVSASGIVRVSDGVVLSSTGYAPSYSADGARIVYQDGGVMVMNSDGSGKTRLTTGTDLTPVFSPDGGRIAFVSNRGQGDEIYVMNADGSGQQSVTAEAVAAREPSWSPDGSRIAYECDHGVGAQTSYICTIQVDGTGRLRLEIGTAPDYSPDGAKIAFTSDQHSSDPDDQCNGYFEVYTMNADGTHRLQYSIVCSWPDYVQTFDPAWSPDGTQIAYNWVHEVDGDTYCELVPFGPSGLCGPQSRGRAAWQPLILGGYPRPKAATPLYASFVPAYRGCTTFNRVHAPPLSHPSCSPPDPTSGTLTVGTPDANANPANFTGSARYRVITGDPATPLDEADVAIDVSLVDVRCAITSPACPGGPLSDYTGPLLLINPPLQVTDKDGQPATNGQGASTGLTNFPVPFDCTPTASASIGSSCSVSTTADAVIPNVIKEGHRAIWESGPVHVRDAGPNGTGFGPGCPPTCGDGDETLFLRQGIFVP